MAELLFLIKADLIRIGMLFIMWALTQLFEHLGFDLPVTSPGLSVQQEKCHKEKEAVEEERRARMRCHQDQRETSDDQPSELVRPIQTENVIHSVLLCLGSM